ncbi:MAG: xylulokinase [Acidimicrobiales bacterium]
MSLILGVDAGTTSTKVGLFADDGTELATAGEEYALSSPKPEWVELSPALYWDALVLATRRALSAAGASGADVSALAVSSQGETVLAVSSAGEPLGPAIVWLDNRAVDEARRISQVLDDAAVYAATGVPVVVPTWTACKLLWWKEHEPGLFQKASHFLLLEEHLLQRLTGRFVSEAGVQSTSLFYDITRHQLWEPMLDLVGVSPDRFGEGVMPGEVVGHLVPEAAEALGLRPGVPVVAGGMDQCSGAVGVGNFSPGTVSESTGGALTLQACTDRPDGDASGRTPVYLHSVPGMYLYCPVCPTGGMAFTWFRDNFGGLELERAAEQGVSAYDLLTEIAARVAPGSDGLIMLPHLQGAFSPENEPGARGVFFGFTLAHGRGHFVRAALEAVAYMLRSNVEMLATVTGQPASGVRSHGGGAKSPLWCQIKADVCSLPVTTLQGTEAAVRGDAMLAGVATGVFPSLDEAAAAMVKPGEHFEPNVSHHDVYEAAYHRYNELFEKLRPLFATTGR